MLCPLNLIVKDIAILLHPIFSFRICHLRCLLYTQRDVTIQRIVKKTATITVPGRSCKMT